VREGGIMPTVRPSVDFNYNDISDLRHKYAEPVYITKNGTVSIETYKEITGGRKLYDLLEDGMNDIKNGNVLTEEEMDKELDLM
jgi:hypothetical protein